MHSSDRPASESEWRVVGAILLSSAGFRGGEEGSRVSLLGTRKRSVPRI